MINRLPNWFLQEIPQHAALERMRFVSEYNLNTVCQKARCPNLGWCFKNNTLTFLILGDICTRSCRFCAISKSRGKVLALDKEEPHRIAHIVRLLGLKYVIITSVTRDDLSDRGAGQFAKTLEAIYSLDRDIGAEILIPDFSGDVNSLKMILDTRPSVIAHNLDTVKRIHKYLKPQASYQLSLDLLKRIKKYKKDIITKSSLMLGLGETDEDLKETMQDLRYSGCDILTLGQYLPPSQNHYPIREFISIDRFKSYEQMGYSLGFKAVLSGPLVRSSYKAEEVYNRIKTYA
ncbi:MAG: lipoyl synthase [Candidatus Omnitrophica bacterium]|nr:lipoyl synthase [Candidatus Omnitrophota bacterium]